MGRRRPPSRDKEAEESVRAVYLDLAARPIDRSCELRTDCCRFRITGKVPQLTRGEALVLARGLRASGRRNLPQRDDGSCPLLDPLTSRCIAYDHRPFGCRTHFCAPAGGPLSRRDVIDLIRRLEDIDALLGGDGARAIQGALADAISTI